MLSERTHTTLSIFSSTIQFIVVSSFLFAGFFEGSESHYFLRFALTIQYIFYAVCKILLQLFILDFAFLRLLRFHRFHLLLTGTLFFLTLAILRNFAIFLIFSFAFLLFLFLCILLAWSRLFTRLMLRGLTLL